MAKGKVNRSGLNAQQLREFRSKVAALKKAGLVSKRTDARSQKPTRYMKAKVKALGPVLSGEMTGVKVDRQILQRYRDGGFKIINGRVMVNKDHDEIAKAKKGELISLRKLTPNYPFEKIVMPYRINTMSDFFAAARQSPPDPVIFSSKKNELDSWAFTYFGWNSLETFDDLGLLAETLEHYSNIEGASAEDLTEIFSNFILYRTLSSAWAPRNRPGFTEKPRRRSKTVQDRRLEMKGREKMQVAHSDLAAQNAKHQRDWRARQREAKMADPNKAAIIRKRKADEMKAYRARIKARDGGGFNPT